MFYQKDQETEMERPNSLRKASRKMPFSWAIEAARGKTRRTDRFCYFCVKEIFILIMDLKNYISDSSSKSL